MRRAPPANDSLAGAINVTAGSTTTFDASEATLEPVEGTADGCFQINATVWYVFTPATTVDVTVTLEDGDGVLPDTAGVVLGVWSGPSDGPSYGDLTSVTCNDDVVPGTFWSQASFRAWRGAPTTCRPAATGPPRARTARGSSVSASARPRPRPRRTTRSRTRTCSSANRCTASASGRRSAWSWGSGHRSRCAPTPAATSGSRARSWWRSPDPASSRGRDGCRSSGRGDPQEPALPPDGSLPRHRDRRTQRRAHAEHDTRDVDPRRQAEQADEVASRG